MNRYNRKSTNCSLSLESLERRDVPAAFMPHGTIDALLVATERADLRAMFVQRIEARDLAIRDRLLARFESTTHTTTNAHTPPIRRALGTLFPSFPTSTNPTGVYLGSFNPGSTVPSISYGAKLPAMSTVPTSSNPFTPHPTPTNPKGVYLGSFNPGSTVPSISYGAKLSTTTTTSTTFNPFTPHPTPINPNGVYLGSFNPASTVPSISYAMLSRARK